jgi:hypothetical protein
MTTSYRGVKNSSFDSKPIRTIEDGQWFSSAFSMRA